MKLVRQTESWNCLIAAVATHLFCLCDDPIGEMVKLIGHDGSDVVREGDTPFNRRGFHYQEVIQACLNENLATTQIDALPGATPSIGAQPYYWTSILGEDCTERFDRYLKTSYGWLAARNRFGVGHALAYDYAMIGNPATGEMFTYRTKQDTESRGLYLVSLFRLDRMES